MLRHPFVHLGQVIGKFRLDRRLGQGAMGDVYLGVHVELGSFVAIKILNAAACAEPNGIARFVNEAKAVAEIDHEQIARVIDQDTLPDGTPYIVMEFVEGVTLRELLDERGGLGLRLTVELLLDVLAALSVAHARGIVHRDLKPENIRVTKSGRAKILDFGIAKRVTEAPTPLTQQGMLVGTPFYMSPEQIDGQPLDGRSDLYAVGVVLFECVTGKRPFEGSTVMALLNRHLHEAPVSPRLIRAEITPALETVILRAMEKPPVLRFGSAEEFSTALRKLFDELPVDGPVVRRIRQPQDIATPSVSMEQGTTEEAFSRTVRSPRKRRLPFIVLAIVVTSAVLVSPLIPSEVEDSLTVDAGPAPVLTSPVLPSEVQGVPPADAGSGPSSPLRANGGPRIKRGAPSTALGVTGVARPLLPAVRLDFDPRAFDAIEYITRAEALARANMPDAVLTNFNVSGLFTGDLVDLTASREFHADYYFRSPARSIADPRLREEDQDIPCLHYVVVTAKKIESYTADSFRSCKEKPLPRIACPIGAAVRQAPHPARAMNVAWLHDGWFLDFGEEGSRSAPCP